MTCGEPEKIDNGNIVGPTKYIHNTKIVYVCQTGFTLDGADTVQCIEGVWDKPAPECHGKELLWSTIIASFGKIHPLRL